MTSLTSRARGVRALGICACALAPGLALALLGCPAPYFSASESLVATFGLSGEEAHETRHFTAFARSNRERFAYTQSLHTTVSVCRTEEQAGAEPRARVRVVADAPYTDVVEGELGETPCMIVELTHGDDGRRSTGAIERGVTIEVERPEGASPVGLFVHVALEAHVECRDDYSAPDSFVAGIEEND